MIIFLYGYTMSRNAFDLHQQALDIYQNTYGNDHPIVAKVSRIHFMIYVKTGTVSDITDKKLALIRNPLTVKIFVFIFK